MVATMQQLVPSFEDFSRDSQMAFREIMQANAHPGRIVTIALPLAPPADVGVGAAAIVLTLVDGETELWLSSSLRPLLGPWLQFHCGCRIASGDRLDVPFALAARGDDHPPLRSALLADPERPDLSTTLIVECEALTDGVQRRATGPGIAGAVTIAPRGVPEPLWAERRALRPLLPMGVDLLLTAGRDVMAIPRTTRIEEID